MRYPGKQLLLGAVVALSLAVAPASATNRQSLHDVLAYLQGEGYPLVFSTDTVHADMYLDAPEITLQAVERSLANYGLELDRSGGLWVVVPSDTTSVLTVQLVSSSGNPVREPAITVAGTAAPLQRVGNGAFAVSAEPGTIVWFTASGHQPTEVEMTHDGQIVVLSAVRALETVIVAGSRHQLAPSGATGSATRLMAEEMRVIPALGGDSIRVANRLPGMSSVGVSAKPRIRGGLQNETLILVDGIELIEAFHLADFQSVFSSIDDRTVDSIDVYTGGFPARYGNRMSGVMDVAMLDEAETPGSEVGLSIYTAFANTRGRSADHDTHWLASVRHGNLELLINRINSRTGKPKYYDAFARVGHKFNDHTELLFGAFASRDDVKLSDGDETSKSDIDSRYLWTRLNSRIREGLDNTTLLSYISSTREKNQLSPQTDEDIRGFLDHDQDAEKLGLRTDFSMRWRNQLIEFGSQLEYARADYDTRAIVERGALAVLLGRNPIDVFDVHESPDGWTGGVYLSGDFDLTERLSIQPGIRWDFQDYYTNTGSTDHASPRIGVRYEIDETMLVRLDVGRFYQPEGIQAMQTTDGVDVFQPPQRADHFIAGWYWDPSPDWKLRAEVYRKRYGRTSLRFENIFNPFVILAELEPDRVPIAPQRAEAWGVDLEARHELSASLSGTLRYSYMDADDRINGSWVPRRWSQRHTVNAILAWERESYTLAAALAWHTGWRTSVPPGSIGVGETLPIESLLNNTELREYFSVDLSASKTWTIGGSMLTVFADLTNSLDRNNVAGIDYDLELEDGELIFEPDNEVLFPLIPLESGDFPLERPVAEAFSISSSNVSSLLLTITTPSFTCSISK